MSFRLLTMNSQNKGESATGESVAGENSSYSNKHVVRNIPDLRSLPFGEDPPQIRPETEELSGAFSIAGPCSTA